MNIRELFDDMWSLYARINPQVVKVKELIERREGRPVKNDHIAIRTSSYAGIEKRNKSVQVHGLSYVIKKIESEDSLLIVDDVFDTGLSINQIILDIKKACKKNTPEIRIATPYFKPTKNKTDRKPDYFIHETDNWLVFPHELHGLSIQEISENKPELKDLIPKISEFIQ